MVFCLIFFINVILSFQLVKMRIENHIHIRHIMFYHFEEDWNGTQLFRDLNELFGNGIISKGQKCLIIEIWWSISSFFICETCIIQFELEHLSIWLLLIVSSPKSSKWLYCIPTFFKIMEHNMTNMDMIFDTHFHWLKKKNYFYEKKLNKTSIFKKNCKKSCNNYAPTYYINKNINFARNFLTVLSFKKIKISGKILYLYFIKYLLLIFSII